MFTILSQILYVESFLDTAHVRVHDWRTPAFFRHICGIFSSSAMMALPSVCASDVASVASCALRLLPQGWVEPARMEKLLVSSERSEISLFFSDAPGVRTAARTLSCAPVRCLNCVCAFLRRKMRCVASVLYYLGSSEKQQFNSS